ncbi:MAG: DUF3531 family protein [Cyanobacteriota bacterium]|nr:DUF3531 family protein [Cyanobacteriota bacterium]
MLIEFRECDWADLWIWFEFAEPPVEAEKEYLEQVLNSWYTLGMLGGFNAASLVAQEAGVDISYLDYLPPEDSLPSMMHNMGSPEYQEEWGRCWFDLGTADALSLDVLLSTLTTLSLEYVGLQRVIVGGVNEDWPVPLMQEEFSANGYSDNHFDEDPSLG